MVFVLSKIVHVTVNSPKASSGSGIFAVDMPSIPSGNTAVEE